MYSGFLATHPLISANWRHDLHHPCPELTPQTRRFVLAREVEEKPVFVAEGVVFASGKAVLSWLKPASDIDGNVEMYASLRALLEVHGDGKTVVQWVD